MEKLEKILKVYCLYDKEINVYECFMTSFADTDALDSYFDLFRNMIFAHDSEDDLSKINEKFKNTCIVKLADFDNLKGEFINDKNILVDYFDIQIVKNYFKKSEVKENNV